MAISALLDQNGRQTMIGLLNTNGSTITRVTANPANHGLSIDDNTTGTDHGGNHAAIDENERGTLFALSSANDGTLVALYTDSSGKLLIQSA